MTKIWQKYIDKLNLKDKLIFIDIIQKLLSKHFDCLDIKQLKGYKNKYRCRVGNKRIIFSINCNEITIEKIGPRGDIYKKSNTI